MDNLQTPAPPRVPRAEKVFKHSDIDGRPMLLSDDVEPLANCSIFVVSLPNATARRMAFSARAEGCGLNWNFFDAYDRLLPSLDYCERDAIIHTGRPLHTRELGCYSSHFALWEKIASSDMPQAIILEDDVVLDWNFARVLLSRDMAAENIHYLKLYYMRAVPFRMLRDPFLGRNLVRFSGFAYGMQAYLLTREGAQRLVEKLRHVSRPVDDELDRDWNHGLPNLAVFPFPAFESLGPSTIGDERYDHAAVPRSIALARLAYRVREKISRMLHSTAWRRVRR